MFPLFSDAGQLVLHLLNTLESGNSLFLQIIKQYLELIILFVPFVLLELLLHPVNQLSELTDLFSVAAKFQFTLFPTL